MDVGEAPAGRDALPTQRQAVRLPLGELQELSMNLNVYRTNSGPEMAGKHGPA